MAQIGLTVTATNPDGGQFYSKEFWDSQEGAACRHAAQVQKAHPAAQVAVTWGTGHGVYWPEVEDRRRNPERYKYDTRPFGHR